jgi:hypothetical protein
MHLQNVEQVGLAISRRKWEALPHVPAGGYETPPEDWTLYSILMCFPALGQLSYAFEDGRILTQSEFDQYNHRHHQQYVVSEFCRVTR